MQKVRTEERLDRKLTEKGIRAALKYVASIQDQQREEDIEAQRVVVAPSLCRHKTKLLQAPPQAQLQVGPGPTGGDDSTDPTQDASNNRTLLEGEGDTEVDEWLDDKDEDSPSEEEMDNMDEEVQVQRRQKKKRGDGLPALIEAMRKHPRPVGGNLKKSTVSLVSKVPPIPARKGKKPRQMYVYYLSSRFSCHTLMPRRSSSFLIHHTPAQSLLPQWSFVLRKQHSFTISSD